MNTLWGNAFLGLILVFLILLLFFQFRLAFWVSIGLPISLLMTLGFMPYLGFAVNMMTIGSVILMLGMLVDDAIVTSESIFTQKEKGLDPKEASIEGTSAVMGPVIVSSLTTVLAFLPMAFIGGLAGNFMWAIPVMVLLCLGASLFECKCMLPSHLAHGKKGAIHQKKWFSKIQSFYNYIIIIAIHWRKTTVILFCVFFVLVTLFGISVLGFNLNPESDIDSFLCRIELPKGSSFSHTSQKVQEIEKLMRAVIPERELLHIATTIGHHDIDLYGSTQGLNPAWALVKVQLIEDNKRKSNTLDLLTTLRKKSKKLQGFHDLFFRVLEDAPIPAKPIQIEIIGNDPTGNDLAQILIDFLKKYPGVIDIYTSHKIGKDIVELKLDHIALANRGLTVSDITQAVRIAFDGEVVNSLQTVDEKIDYRLQFSPREHGKLETLKNLVVINKQGSPIQLQAVCDFELHKGEAAIKHYFGQRTITLFGDIDRAKVDVMKINNDIAKFVETEKLLKRFSRLRLLYTGEIEEQKEVHGNMGSAFIICLISIFFILVVLFNSLIKPFLVMIVIPFGFCGVVIGYGIHGIPLSMIALLGIIGLAGVLVNDSLVMISWLNKMQKGKEFLSDEEIAIGAAQRLRPIIITSLTTVAGLFPSAYGIAGDNPMIRPMVMAMAWGILFGTIITLILLPCLYAISQDVRKQFSVIINFIIFWKRR